MGETIFSPMVTDAIGEIMNISLGSSATAVSNMLDHRVDITTPTVRVVNAEDFTLGEIEPAVGVEIKYVCGVEGSNIMMLKRSDVKAIVDILLGSETEDEEFQLDELSVSVVCEVMNQMMGAASTALSDLLGRMVNISTPESFEMDDLDKVRREHFPVQTGPVVVVSFKLSIEGIVESEFMNVMSVELVQELVSGFGIDLDNEGATDSAPPPPPAPAPTPAPAPEPSGSGGTLSQEEIERLLAGGADSEPAPAPAPTPAPAPAAAQTPPPQQMPAGQPAAGQPPYYQAPPGGAPYPQVPGQGGYP